MSQQKSNSNSILLQVYSGLLKGCGCCLLLGLIGFIAPVVFPLRFSFGIGAKQSEAKQYVASMNKNQQAYFAENSVFATSVNTLKIDIKTETNNYKYSIRATKKAAFNYAFAKDKNLKDYFGGVFLIPAKELDPNADRDEMMTETILCETEKRPLFRVKRTDQPDEPAEPIYQNGEVICGKGTTLVTK